MDFINLHLNIYKTIVIDKILIIVMDDLFEKSRVSKHHFIFQHELKYDTTIDTTRILERKNTFLRNILH